METLNPAALKVVLGGSRVEKALANLSDYTPATLGVATAEELTKLLGTVRAEKLVAALELGRAVARAEFDSQPKPQIETEIWIDPRAMRKEIRTQMCDVLRDMRDDAMAFFTSRLKRFDL